MSRRITFTGGIAGHATGLVSVAAANSLLPLKIGPNCLGAAIGMLLPALIDTLAMGSVYDLDFFWMVGIRCAI